MQDGDREVCRTLRIRVLGTLDPSWSDWFGGMDVSVEAAEGGVTVTSLTGPVIDQAALYGILRKLEGLNLELVSVNRDSAEDSQTDRSI